MAQKELSKTEKVHAEHVRLLLYRCSFVDGNFLTVAERHPSILNKRVCIRIRCHAKPAADFPFIYILSENVSI